MSYTDKDQSKKRGRKNDRRKKPKKEFKEVLLEVRRVTRVTTWWRQLAFRAIIVIGNNKWKIGLWVAKGTDVSIAVAKATHEAYKNVVVAPIAEWFTVPYALTHKYKAAIIKLMPASEGTWLKAWSSVRTVLELAWYTNILSKIVGTNNKLNNAIAAIQWLAKYKVGKSPKKVVSDKDKKIKWEDVKTKVVETKITDSTKNPTEKEVLKKEKTVE